MRSRGRLYAMVEGARSASLVYRWTMALTPHVGDRPRVPETAPSTGARGCRTGRATSRSSTDAASGRRRSRGRDLTQGSSRNRLRRAASAAGPLQRSGARQTEAHDRRSEGAEIFFRVEAIGEPIASQEAAGPAHGATFLRVRNEQAAVARWPSGSGIEPQSRVRGEMRGSPGSTGVGGRPEGGRDPTTFPCSSRHGGDDPGVIANFVREYGRRDHGIPAPNRATSSSSAVRGSRSGPFNIARTRRSRTREMRPRRPPTAYLSARD